MENPEKSLRQTCAEIFENVQPIIAHLKKYSWVGRTRDHQLEFIRRAAIVRQYEAAHAILHLVDAGRGSASVTMIRPAYEEMLWLEYLKTCGDKAGDLVRLITDKELLDNYSAQKQYLGQRAIRQIGFTSRVSKKIEKGLKDPKDELLRMGKELGWRKRAVLPSVAFIAKKTKRYAQYKFLYQGTSRSVHFSALELQRRVWGQHGSVTIGSSSFDQYWSDFALSWSFRILIETIAVSESDFSGIVFDDSRLLELIADLRPVQILTATELEAWEEPSGTSKTS